MAETVSNCGENGKQKYCPENKDGSKDGTPKPVRNPAAACRRPPHTIETAGWRIIHDHSS